MQKRYLRSIPILPGVIFLCALALGLFTTLQYVSMRGLDYLEQDQLARHQAVLAGNAGDPWQYRILSAYLVQGALDVCQSLSIPHPAATAFIAFRIAQDTLILLLASAYYRRLGLRLPAALLGMALLAWGMSYSHFDSDLQFGTFFDLLFYLLAGLLILQRRFLWIIPLTALAALNRETSGLIPFLLLAVGLFALPRPSRRRTLPIFAAAFGLYLAIFFGLRLAYGAQTPILPYGHTAGLDLLGYNLLRPVTWSRLVATFSIIPLVALIGWRRWTPHLRLFFWALVPVWLGVHAVAAVLAETRLLLVPQALVFIPAALLALNPPPAGADNLPAEG